EFRRYLCRGSSAWPRVPVHTKGNTHNLEVVGSKPTPGIHLFFIKKANTFYSNMIENIQNVYKDSSFCSSTFSCIVHDCNTRGQCIDKRCRSIQPHYCKP